jgi:hypothetical protein
LSFLSFFWFTTSGLPQCPEVFDLNEVIKAKAFDPSALHTVLFQEIERYNILLRSIREQCSQLEKGIQGLVAMSADLQIIFSAFSRALVPAMWVKYAFYSIFLHTQFTVPVRSPILILFQSKCVLIILEFLLSVMFFFFQFFHVVSQEEFEY